MSRHRILEGKLPPMSPDPSKCEVCRIEARGDGKVNDSIHAFLGICRHCHDVFLSFNFDWDHYLGI